MKPGVGFRKEAVSESGKGSATSGCSNTIISSSAAELCKYTVTCTARLSNTVLTWLEERPSSSVHPLVCPATCDHPREHSLYILPLSARGLPLQGAPTLLLYLGKYLTPVSNVYINSFYVLPYIWLQFMNLQWKDKTKYLIQPQNTLSLRS